MKYTDKFKLKCVLNYQNGKKIKAPCSVGKKIFMTYVKRWIKLYKDLGEEGLKHNSKNKKWTTKERFKLVSKYIKGKSINSISLKNHINPGQLYKWIKIYNEKGLDGLKSLKKGKPILQSIMKKNKTLKSKNTFPKKDELKRLKERNEYLETEVAYLKKLNALVSKKEAAQAKAKKQK